MNRPLPIDTIPSPFSTESTLVTADEWSKVEESILKSFGDMEDEEDNRDDLRNFMNNPFA